MKKILLTVISLAATFSVIAGGTNVNTNHGVAYLRGVARGTTLDPDAVYHNPAGASFMKDGFHFALNIQEALQERGTVSTFAPFAYNVANNNSDTREFMGKTFAPVIPSFDFIWKKNRWAVMASFGVGGGGGSAKYDNGLASFESLISQIPFGVGMQLAGQPFPYSLDMNIKGNSITYQGQVGVSFRITKWLAVAAQARINYATKSYSGYLKNIQMANPLAPGTMASAPTILGTLAQQAQANGDAVTATQLGTYAVMTGDHTLDVEQSGVSISPVIAIMFNYKGWALTGKYEFRQAVTLTNKTAEVTATDPVLGTMFPDGGKVKADMPALLSLAVSKTIRDKVTITAEWHHYFDRDAYNSFTTAILGNTNEYLLGVEYKINDKWLVSAGYQFSDFNIDPAQYSDLDFTCDAHTIGLGFAYNFSKHIRLNAGVMKPFYKEVERESAIYNDNSLGLAGKDVFKFSRWSWGLGVDFHF